MKGTMPVSFVGKFASGGGTIRTRLLDPGCGVMTSPKPAHETIPNWPPSNWNGGRDQIGIGGRLRWNLQAEIVENRLWQRHQPLLVALADDAQHPAGTVDGGDFQRRGLADPQAAGIHNGQAGAM